LATFWRLPVSALKRAVLPVLGLPTRATSGARRLGRDGREAGVGRPFGIEHGFAHPGLLDGRRARRLDGIWLVLIALILRTIIR
jgi:hypothetical protein